MLSPMIGPMQTTRMRRLPTGCGVCPTFSDEIPDVKRFAHVNWWKSLTWEGKCFCRKAKPAHIGGHLPRHKARAYQATRCIHQCESGDDGQHAWQGLLDSGGKI